MKRNLSKAHQVEFWDCRKCLYWRSSGLACQIDLKVFASTWVKGKAECGVLQWSGWCLGLESQQSISMNIICWRKAAVVAARSCMMLCWLSRVNRVCLRSPISVLKFLASVIEKQEWSEFWGCFGTGIMLKCCEMPTQVLRLKYLAKKWCCWDLACTLSSEQGEAGKTSLSRVLLCFWSS